MTPSPAPATAERTRLPAPAPSQAAPGPGVAPGPDIRGAGNQAVQRLLVSDAQVAQMRQDIELIVARLKQQVLEAPEEQEILDRVKAWASWDESLPAVGQAGTPFLDKFLSLLKQRVFSRSTARMLFGLAGDEWMNAYDGMFYELEDERLDELRRLVAKSRAQGTGGPETQQMQSVYGFVGKRVGLGAWGILKNMGLTVTSMADAMIWAQWRTNGLPGDPPQLSSAVASQFDEAAGALADLMKEGATPEEIEREKQEMMEAYGFGDRWGKVVGILMSAGMGSAGKAVKAVSTVAQMAQGAQGVENAARAMYKRVEEIRKDNPQATWKDFIADDEVQVELGNGLAAVIGLVGQLAGDEGATAEFFKRFNLLVDAAVLAPMIKRAWMDYNDPKLDPVERSRRLEDHIRVIGTTIATMIAGKIDAKRSQQTAAGTTPQEHVPPPAEQIPPLTEQAPAPAPVEQVAPVAAVPPKATAETLPATTALAGEQVAPAATRPAAEVAPAPPAAEVAPAPPAAEVAPAPPAAEVAPTTPPPAAEVAPTTPPPAAEAVPVAKPPAAEEVVNPPKEVSPTEPTGPQRSLEELRELAPTDPEAAHELWSRYQGMSDFEIFRLFADEGDPTAAAVIRQRFPSNEAALMRALGSDYRPPHSATAILTREGGEVSRQPLESGRMTPEERALGFPRNMLATHTEARAVRQTDLRPGDVLEIRGQYDPCTSCQRTMRAAATGSGATVRYWWPGGSAVYRP